MTSEKNCFWKNHKYGFMAAGLSFGLFFLIFLISGRIFVGDGVFMHDDLLAGCAHGSLRDFLKKGFSTYTFTSAMGMDTVQALPSPFLLLVLFFKNLNIGYFLAISLKLALAAFLCELFLEKHIFRTSTMQAVPFAVMYGLCGYCMIYYYNQHFLEGVYMLPYIMNCELFILKEKTHRKRLVLALTYLFLITYYEGYMVGIFLAFAVFLYVCIFENKHKFKRLLSTLLELMGEALFAAGLSAVVLLPLGLGLFAAGTIDEAGSTIAFSPRVNDVAAGFFAFAKKDQTATIPALYTGISLLVLIAASFSMFKKYKKQIGLFLGCLLFWILCIFLKPFYYGIHMFNYPDGSWYRFAYMVSFTLCTYGAFVWKEKAFHKRGLILGGLVWGILYVVLWSLQEANSSYDMLSVMGCVVNLVLLAAYVFTMGEYPKKKKVYGSLFLSLVVMEVLANGVYITRAQGYGPHEYRANYDAWFDKNTETINAIQNGDDSLYRVRFENVHNFNQSSYFGYNSMAVFTPAIDPEVKRAVSNLGYATGTKGIFSIGGSPATTSLLGEKYIILADNKGIGDYYVQDNETALPFVYASSPYVKIFSMLQTNPFENQNGLLSCLVGEECNLFMTVDGEMVQIETENVQILYDEEHTSNLFLQEDETKDSALVFAINGNDKPIYVLFEQVAYEFDREAPRIVTKQTYGQYEDLTLYLGNLIPLIPDENGISEVSIVFNKDMSGGGLLKNFLAYTYDASVWERAYEKLKDGQMRNITWDGTTLTGDITVGEERAVLFTSIPYSEYWKVTIDGEVVTTYATLDGAFLAADITPGQHHVEMSYHNKMRMVGGIISLISAVAYISWCIIAAKCKKKDVSEIVGED